ncbi:MAG: oligosaccharide flippase family protein, partial [Firmicutes bacterium]|nr:oligosaccharide flippase family protein [Bacillota bacterium]
MVSTVERVSRRAWSGLGQLCREILARPFVRHVGALTMANGVSAVLSFAQGILVARWLGPELYGVAALVMSFPAMVYTFFDARSAEASVKYLSEFHARGERERVLAMCKVGYAVDLAVAAVAFSGVVATAPWAASSVVHRP